MKKSNLIISGSSFLLPKSTGWNSLYQNYDLKFSDYNTWDKSLFNDLDNDIVIILFIEDLFKDYHIKKNINSTLRYIQDAFIWRTNKSKKKTIVIISSYREKDLLRISSNLLTFNKLEIEVSSILLKIQKKAHNLNFLNLTYLLAFNKPAENIFDYRNHYFAGCRLSIDGINFIADTLNEILLKKTISSSKVLAIDCDNTIWGGVIGESDLRSLELGQDGKGLVFQDIQKEIVKLVNEGVLLVLLSKNNFKDVMTVFSKHNGMIIKKKHILISKVNWNEKYKNILEISKMINIGLSDFVFLDDNPYERDLMKKMCPEVKTIDLPESVYLWPDILRNLTYFSKDKIVNEDLNKVKQYKNRQKFIDGIKKTKSVDDYLKKINIKLKKYLINSGNIARASQITLKTNQFNLRTNRLLESSILDIIKIDKELIFVGDLNDIYGNHGIILFVRLSIINKEYIFIEDLMVSCRALGRKIENWIFLEIIKIALKRNYKKLIGGFIPTAKNDQVKHLYQNLGFKKVKKKDLGLSYRFGKNEILYIYKIQ